MSWKRRVWCSGLVWATAMFPLAAVAADPPIDSAPPGAGTCDVAPKTVEFKGSSARLTPEAKAVLDDVVVWAKTTKDRSLRLRGPAEGSATTANAKLHQRRTTAVMTYLNKQGVEPSRINAGDRTSFATGENNPNSSTAGSKPNVVEIDTCSTSLAMTVPERPVVAATSPTEAVPTAPSVPTDSAAIPPAPVPPPLATATTPATPPGNVVDRTAAGAPNLTKPPEPPVAMNPETNPAMNPAMNPAISPPMNPPRPEPLAREENPSAPSDGSYRPHSRVGVGTTVGGGVIGFADEQARAFTQTGGSWETRVTAGTREYVALEAAYVGSAQSINALGLGSNARLIGNGAEGDLRVNLTRQMVQPYLFGGLGFNHYSLSMSGANTSSLRDSDNLMTVPFGVGLSLRVAQGFLIDLRGTGRAAFYDDLMDGPYAATGQDAKLHSWNVAGRLGWEF